MLVMTRKKNEKILIADNIEITILEVGRNRVRFGVQAPKEVRVNTRVHSSAPVADNVRPFEIKRPAEFTDALPIAVGMTDRR